MQIFKHKTTHLHAKLNINHLKAKTDIEDMTKENEMIKMNNFMQCKNSLQEMKTTSSA